MIVEGLQGEIHAATMYIHKGACKGVKLECNVDHLQATVPGVIVKCMKKFKWAFSDGWFSYRDSFSFILTNYFIHTAVILSSSVSFASWPFFLLLTSHSVLDLPFCLV